MLARWHFRAQAAHTCPLSLPPHPSPCAGWIRVRISRSSAYDGDVRGLPRARVHLVDEEPPTVCTELIYADREQGRPAYRPAYLQLMCELIQDPVLMAGRPRCNTAVRAATCDSGGAGAKTGRVQAAASKCARGASTHSTHTTTLASASSALWQTRPARARPTVTCVYILVHGPHTRVPRLAATRARPEVAARPSPSRQQTPPR
ncbi:hypothetical protein T492DRAFT_1075166 [Pavlovales sp. CCMP2436]|nr:hypothetical protein T492DRAFT_1075166 [Pavlovales sp. CCMP2436]